jgi:carbon storage regulator
MMLVLNRKLGEEVMIGGNIRLTVVAIRGSFVRLAFRAPPEVSIQRQERCQKPEDSRTLVMPPATLDAEP